MSPAELAGLFVVAAWVLGSAGGYLLAWSVLGHDPFEDQEEGPR